MNTKRLIISIATTLFFITVHAQEPIVVPDSIMQRVYQQAYQYVKVYEPDSSYMISPYIEEFDYSFSFKDSLTAHRKLIVEDEFWVRLVHPDTPGKPVWSNLLFNTFKNINKEITDPQYEIWFGQRLGDMVACTVYVYGKHDAWFGYKYVYLFGFSYYTGDIDLMLRSEIQLM